jgi:hypothetical protein
VKKTAAASAKYDERVLTIENEFFNDEAEATSRAKIILDDEANYANTYILTVKGNPALANWRCGQCISIRQRRHIRHQEIRQPMGSWKVFSQILTVKKKTFRTFFTVGISTIGGVDVIAP